MLCLRVKVSISSCFHAFQGLKQYPNLVRRGFLLFHTWKYLTKQVHLRIKKWKTLKARLHSIRALNLRPEGNLSKACEKDLQIQSFWISQFSFNLFPSVSRLYDSFENNEGLLRGQDYRKGKRFVGTPHRKFLIPKENKKRIY